MIRLKRTLALHPHGWRRGFRHWYDYRMVRWFKKRKRYVVLKTLGGQRLCWMKRRGYEDLKHPENIEDRTSPGSPLTTRKPRLQVPHVLGQPRIAYLDFSFLWGNSGGSIPISGQGMFPNALGKVWAYNIPVDWQEIKERVYLPSKRGLISSWVRSRLKRVLSRKNIIAGELLVISNNVQSAKL